MKIKEKIARLCFGSGVVMIATGCLKEQFFTPCLIVGFALIIIYSLIPNKS